ncbi:MAG TPA: hypothetical protein DCE39_04885, partial [Planctomycetaceae bacterium]|nr:hypothetical protein [Planctomycetaceae bacterium]
KRRLHPLTLSGKGPKIQSGFGMGTPFSLDFVLAPGKVFDRFSCRVGLHPTAGPRGAVAFVIMANGKQLLRTAVLKSGAPPISIQVDLPQADVLKLSLRTVAQDGSDSSHNLAAWANPVLHRHAN